MSNDIYSRFFCDTANKVAANICGYAECRQPTVNPRFCNLTCCNRENARIERQRSLDRYMSNPKFCLGCQQVVPYESVKKSGAKYCSNSCASKFTNKKRSQESRNKQRKSLLKKFGCEEYTTTYKEVYYSMAKFSFSVYDYPDLFDLKSLTINGWYSCGGRTIAEENKNGMTRDHKISIRYGMKKNLHPFLLSHPVNCQLLLARDNSSKSAKCSMTIDDLIEQILNFNGEFSHQSKCLNLIKNGIYITDKFDFVQQNTGLQLTE
jgi:hypothetical protein